MSARLRHPLRLFYFIFLMDAFYSGTSFVGNETDGTTDAEADITAKFRIPNGKKVDLVNSVSVKEYWTNYKQHGRNSIIETNIII